MRRIIIVSLLLFPIFASAQYFGRNKPRYKSFDFKIKETPHFELYYYTKNKETVNWMAQESELWYDFFSDILYHEIPFKNPLLVYSNHADFQQTNAIGGAIGVGTGGVTEGFKNRVVMPMTFTNQQTHQVLGHELVHAFQFNIVIDGEGTSIRNMSNLPLWLVEGMAEYLSIGRVDPFTAMWMRRAILKDDIPTFSEMANPRRYFPYRYGQTAWSFLAGKYGDQMMRTMYQSTAINGVELTIDSLLGIDMEDLSADFDTTLRAHFEPFMRDGKESKIGKTILSKKNSGNINVSPSISPNGKYVVFLSEKDLFSTDLFMAEARTGKIVRKLSSLVKDGDLDAYNYLESSGTWSPDSKKFAFIAFSKGVNKLVIKEVKSGKTLESKTIDQVPAFSTPVWSPDGKEIVITGLVEGQTDLFAYNLKRGRVRQLTDDIYSEIQPDFNSDGTKLVFSYDKRSFDEGRTNGRWSFDLAVMDYQSGSVEILDVFHTADNISANYDHEDNIYFMSDRDGFRNLYKYDVANYEVYHMTDYLSGLSGISRFSPMITSSSKVDRVLFSYYGLEGYDIITAKSTQLLNKKVDKNKVDFSAGSLPNPGSENKEIVTEFHESIDEIEYLEEEEFRNTKYKTKFELDYIGGGGGIGVSNGLYNNQVGLQGGIDMLFGDMLGNNQLFAQVALNGTIYDMGGQVNYINKKNPIAWGFGISHIPQVTGFRSLGFGSLLDDDGNVVTEQGSNAPVESLIDELNLIRVFNQSLGGFAQLPFSTKLRLEAGASIGHQGFRWDVTRNYFSQDGFLFYNQTRDKVDAGSELTFNQYYTIKKGLTGGVNVALVGDNSSFGLTAPLTGHRFRVSAEYSYGVNNYYGLLADYRKYIRLSPVTLAFRGLGYLRYENNVNSVYPLFVGNMGFVRGYDFAFSNGFNDILKDTDIGQFLGSKIALASFEIRLPFTGPGQLAVINTNALFTDLNFFIDAGVAFDEFSHFSDGEPINGQFLKPELAMSAGVSVRVNLFGAMILEPYWAKPLRSGSGISFGLNFIPGW